MPSFRVGSSLEEEKQLTDEREAKLTIRPQTTEQENRNNPKQSLDSVCVGLSTQLSSYAQPSNCNHFGVLRQNNLPKSGVRHCHQAAVDSGDRKLHVLEEKPRARNIPPLRATIRRRRTRRRVGKQSQEAL